jgi:hypothetical protein
VKTLIIIFSNRTTNADVDEAVTSRGVADLGGVCPAHGTQNDCNKK